MNQQRWKNVPSVLAAVLAIVWMRQSVHAELIRGTVTGETGVACRLYVQNADGKYFFAQSADGDCGSAVIYDKNRGESSVEQHTTLCGPIDANRLRFQVDVPPGRYTLTVECGKEFVADRAIIDVADGAASEEVSLRLVRWIDMNVLGWYSGDTHCHRPLDELPNLLRAEDLNVTFPLTYWVRNAYDSPAEQPIDRHPEPSLQVVDQATDIGERHPRVYWPINTEYELFTVHGQRHTEGAVFVLNHQRPMRAAAPPVGLVAAEAEDQRALLDLDKHSWNWSMMIVPVMEVDLFELSNNHVWRTGFLFKNWTIEVCPTDWQIETDDEGFTERGWIDFGFKTYYALLNCGFRMRPTAGTASGVHPVPLGFGRVYVECPNGFNYDDWIDGLDAGRSFITTGPMLTATFNGNPPGTVFESASAGEIRVRGVATAQTPIDRAEIIVNGDVACIIEGSAATRDVVQYTLTIDEAIPVEHSAWIAVRCFQTAEEESLLTDTDSRELGSQGSSQLPRRALDRESNSRDTSTNRGAVAELPAGRFRYAHTSPVHVEIDGPVRPKRHEVNYFIERMNQEIARNRDVLSSEDLAEYESALRIYRKIAERASD